MVLTKENINGVIKELANEYRVRLHFTNGTPLLNGYARYWSNSITISVNQSPISMLCTFFHELGHVYCWEHGLWKSYHIDPYTHPTIEEKRKCIYVAVKAERWVDRWAKKEMKKHFQKIRYIPSYSTPIEVKILKDYIKKLINYE